MFCKVELLALVIGIFCLSPVAVYGALTCANVRCAGGSCRETEQGPQCVPIENPGQCPIMFSCLEPEEPPTCPSGTCQFDSDCNQTQKCCGCDCKKCYDAYIPSTQLTCETTECAYGYECVNFEDGAQCVPIERSGQCPMFKCVTPTKSPEECGPDTCEVDYNCQGTKKCCNACGCRKCF